MSKRTETGYHGSLSDETLISYQDFKRERCPRGLTTRQERARYCFYGRSWKRAHGLLEQEEVTV